MRRPLELIGVRAGEGKKVGRLFVLVLLTMLAVALLKAAHKGLFLAAYDKSRLPEAMSISAISLALCSFGAAALAGRLGTTRLLQLLLGLSAGALAAVRVAFAFKVAGVPFAFYVLVEMTSALLVVQTWSVITEALDLRAARRILPVVGAATGVAWIVGGMGAGVLSKALGTENLLTAAIALFLLCLPMTRIIARRDVFAEPNQGGTRASPLKEAFEGLRFVWGDGLLRVLASVVVLELLVALILDFQLASAAQARFAGADQSARISTFLGQVYAVTGALSLLLPFTVSGRLLTKVGSVRAMMFTPATLLLLGVAMLLVPSFWLIVVAFSAEQVLGRSLSAPARGQIQGALPAARRAQAAPLLRGVIAPLFAAVGGLMLKVFPKDLEVRYLGIFVALLTALLLFVNRSSLKRVYLAALQKMVDRRRLDLGEVNADAFVTIDREQRDALVTEVQSPEAERASFALSILSRDDSEATRKALLQACTHPSPLVRTQAVRAVGRRGKSEDAGVVALVLESAADSELRRACLTALAKLGPQGAKAVVQRCASDPDARTRALAAACFPERSLEAPGTPTEFERLLGSRDDGERGAAAWALGETELSGQQLHDELAALLEDPSVDVRKEALRAAARYDDLAFIKHVVRGLTDRATRRASVEALSRLDDSRVLHVKAALLDASPNTVSWAATALARCAGTRADEVLTELLAHPLVRYRAARGLAVRRALPEWQPPPLPLLINVIRSEIELGYRYYALLLGLARAYGDASTTSGSGRFLTGEVQIRVHQAEKRLLALLALVADPRIARLAPQLRQPSAQVAARVVELLDNALAPEVAQIVIPFIERQPLDARIVAVAQWPLAKAALASPIDGLAQLNDPHLVRCVLLEYRDKIPAERLADLEKEAPLLQLVERVQFLRSVPLFKELSPEDLMKVAEIAQPVEFRAARVIFKKGDPGDAMFVVVRGRVEIQDKGRAINSHGVNEFFGELAILDDEPRAADALCREDTNLLKIGGPDLEELMERRPEIAREVIRVLARRLRQVTGLLVQATGPGHKS